MPVRRERKDAVEHRRVILRTAQALFEEFGVHPVSMHQIAKTAGVGQATLYRRYAHKGELCIDLLQEYVNQWRERLSERLEASKDKPPLERIGTIIDCWIEALEEKSGLITTIEAELHACDATYEFYCTPMYEFLRGNLSGLLADSVASVPGMPPLDVRLTAHALICSMAPSGYFHLKKEGYSTEEIRQGYRRMCHLVVQ